MWYNGTGKKLVLFLEQILLLETFIYSLQEQPHLEEDEGNLLSLRLQLELLQGVLTALEIVELDYRQHL